jgi:probable O-glycosylation ligase (exosortase A-associated)
MKGLIFTYVLTYGGAAASLYRPFIGLLVYVCFAIIRPESLWHWSVPPGNYSRIVAIAMLLGWALHGTGNWRMGRASAITIALLAFWLWTILSATCAPDQEVAWQIFEQLTKIVLPFLVGITLIDSVHKLKQLAWVMVLSQGYVSLEFNLSYLSGFNIAEEGFGSMGRALLGTGLVCCLALAIFLALSDTRWWQKALAAGCGLLIGHAVFLTFSRGAILALIVTGFVSFLVIKKRTLHYLAFAAAVLIGLVMAGPEVRARFATTFASDEERDASAQGRIELWQNCLILIKEAPWVGIGPGHFALVSRRFGWTTIKEAHSLWLQTAAEVGIPGLVFLSLFYALTLWRLWPMLRATPEGTLSWFRSTACMVWAALVGFIVTAFFVSVEGVEIPYYVVLLAAGALKVDSLNNSDIEEPVSEDSDAAVEPDADY